MKITIKLYEGSDHSDIVTKQDIDKNIEALKRAIDGKSLTWDFISLLDTQSILEVIREQLPDGRR